MVRKYLSAEHFCSGGFRRLLRRMVGDTGTAYAAHVGNQRHFIRHYRRSHSCHRRRSGCVFGLIWAMRTRDRA